ncbi:MAG TPA: GNAT family N-acetyltransferase, partial [Puia sp.]|nr:GNAT family N-acetyltransferase [Puia sp.]
ELSRAFQGQGIMHESIEKVIDYAFDTLKVRKILAVCHESNERSVKLLRKLLFRQSGDPLPGAPGLRSYQLINSG